MSESAPVPNLSAPPPETEAPENPTPETPSTWLDSLDADLRQAPGLSNFKSVGDLAKGYLETKSKVGQKGLTLPKADSPPEAWDEIYAAIGRPQSPDQYELGEWAPPKDVPWDPGFQEEALKTLHAAGLSSAQVQKVLGWYGKKAGDSYQGIQSRKAEMTEQWSEQVSKAWGQATPAKLDLANRTFDTFFPEAVKQSIIDAVTPEGGPLGEHPAFLEAMAKIGQHLSEHQLLGDKEPIRFSHTPEEAQAAFDKLLYDKEFQRKFSDPRDPGHKEALEMIRKLSEQIEGGIRPAENTLVG